MLHTTSRSATQRLGRPIVSGRPSNRSRLSNPSGRSSVLGVGLGLSRAEYCSMTAASTAFVLSWRSNSLARGGRVVELRAVRALARARTARSSTTRPPRTTSSSARTRRRPSRPPSSLSTRARLRPRPTPSTGRTPRRRSTGTNGPMAARSRSDVPRSWRSSWSCAACSLRHEATTRSSISGSRAAHARQAADRRLHDDAAGAARGLRRGSRYEADGVRRGSPAREAGFRVDDGRIRNSLRHGWITLGITSAFVER